jgi:hypothetical protein
LNCGLQISNNKLTNRIADLAKVYAATLKEERLRAESEKFTSVIELIEMCLTVHGFAPQSKESLAEATCRALGLTTGRIGDLYCRKPVWRSLVEAV